MSLTATTWQTVGPFFRIGLERFYLNDLTVPGVPGEHIEIRGRVLDGSQHAVPDAVIEIWQADAQGSYFSGETAAGRSKTSTTNKPRESVFRGFGRVATTDDGTFHFKTIKPGQVPAPDGTLQAPHIAVSIFMRGLLRRLTTRIYFAGEPANDTDFALHKVDPARIHTLIAQRSTDRPDMYEWNILLQGLLQGAASDSPHGTAETVFFAC
jgi:protocatechuate 3,4-dioxygenase alpha subunit